MSINNSNNKEQRKPFLALIGDDNTTASILGLMLLAGASFAFISSITPMTAALAQELANNNTTRQAGGAGVQSSACTPTQTGGTFDDGVSVGGTSAFDDYDADMEGEGSSSSSATASRINGTNSTTAGERGGSQSMSEAREHIEEACLILHSGDTQGALMQLNLALNALGDGTQE